MTLRRRLTALEQRSVTTTEPPQWAVDVLLRSRYAPGGVTSEQVAAAHAAWPQEPDPARMPPHVRAAWLRNYDPD